MSGVTDNRETELKLAVRPQDLGVLRAAPVLMQPGPAAARLLESVYYDTLDRRLSGRRVTLRVRKLDDGYVQTIKSAPSIADGLTRGEWEWPVTGAVPDLSCVDDPEARAQLGEIVEADLRPVFATHIRRTLRMVHAPAAASAIEVAIDEGEIRVPDGAALPVSEVELELKEGQPAALYDLALELAKLAPMRLEARTKAARGFALAEGTADGSIRAEKIVFGPGVTVEGALERVIRGCLGHFAANEACALVGTDPEGVHQMRVALRRLRTALSVFRPFLPAAHHDWMVGEVKWLSGCFGPARDWDVFLTGLLAPVAEAMAVVGADGARHLPDDLAALERAARARRDHAYEVVRRTVLSERYGAFQIRLGAWLEARRWRDQPVSEQSAALFQPVADLADHLLHKRHRRVRRSGRDFAALAAEDRHTVRIALKKLRYTAEFFRSLYRERSVRRYVQLVAAFQDALGHLNDVATARRLLRDLHADGAAPTAEEAGGAGVVIGWHARGMHDAEADLLARWDDFTVAKPFWTPPADPASPQPHPLRRTQV